jgi:hypothetical protein
MARRKASWRLVFLSYPCPTCGAAPGEVCITLAGRPYAECHAERTRNGARCPKCGTLVTAEADPGALCPRCALVRALEVERSTTHRRTDP